MAAQDLRWRNVRKDFILDDGQPNDLESKEHCPFPPARPSLLSNRHWLLIFIFVGATFVSSIYLHTWLPTPLPSSNAKPTVFSEIRTREFLERLAAIGPKPSGSDNCDVKAKELILGELEEIRKSAVDVHRIEIDEQMPSGCYDLNRFDRFTLCYKNVVNLVVRLGTVGQEPSKHSVMVNCHFDSWPDSPGASDDGVSCGLLLEILRVFSQSPSPLPHDVIFLFNGAEENILQASHGFITKHPWRHSIRAFVNLEAAGAGGREILFQAGPGNQWLLNTYLSAAPRPHCSIMAQEIFEGGLVPGDTDFRIFRDFGRISGLDIAFIRNGYVYHTEFDKPQYITPGSMQRSGENVLSTVRALVSSPYLARPGDYKQGRSVFFDVLGLFTIIYPLALGRLINYATVMLVVIKVICNFVCHRASQSQFTTQKESDSYGPMDFVEALLLHVGASVSMLLCMFLMSQLVSHLGLSMCWYSTQWLVGPLYALPVVTAGLSLHALAAQYLFQLSSDRVTERCINDAHLLLLAVIVQVLTMADVASAFIFLILTGFPLMRDACLYLLYTIAPDTRPNIQVLLYVHLVSIFPSIVMISYCVHMMLDMFLPIMGRSFTAVDPELPISGQCTAGAVPLVMCIGSLMYVSNSKRLNRLLVRSFVVVAMVVLLLLTTSLGRPYNFSEKSPRLKRISLQHTTRQIYDKQGNLELEDNGLFFAAWDYRGTADFPKSRHFADARPVKCSDKNIFCDLPYYFPVAKVLPPSAFLWKPLTEVPYNSHPTKLELVDKRRLKNQWINMTFHVEGSDHVSLYLTPQEGWRLVGWSLSNQVPRPKGSTFVYLAYGRMLVRPDKSTHAPWDFWLLLAPAQKVQSPEPSIHVAVASHYIHGPNMHSETLKTILNEIKTKRKDPNAWRWAMTANCWCAQVLSKFF